MTKRLLLIASLCVGLAFAVGGIKPAYAQSTCSTDADCGVALRCGNNCGSASQCEFCYSDRVCVDLNGDSFKHCEVLSSCSFTAPSSPCGSSACCDGCPCGSPPGPTNTPRPTPTNTPRPTPTPPRIPTATPTPRPADWSDTSCSDISDFTDVYNTYQNNGDVWLGATIDYETSVNYDDGDDGTTVAGVPLSRAILDPGLTNYFSVTFSSDQDVTGSITGWADWDGPGDSAPVQILSDSFVPVGSTRNYPVSVPATANPNACIRIVSSNSLSFVRPGYNSNSSSGEVEDYVPRIRTTPPTPTPSSTPGVTPSPSPSPSATPSPVPTLYPLVVNVYQDNCGGNTPLDSAAFNVRVSRGAIEHTLGPYSPITTRDEVDTPAGDVYTYVPQVVPGLYLQGCSTVSGWSGPSPQEINLYFLPGVAGWWQAADGDIAANTGSVSSSVPTSCQPSAIPACLPHLMLESTASSQGVILTQSSASGNTYGAALGDETQPDNATNPTSQEYVVEGYTTIDTSLVPREDFDYFVRLLELPADAAARRDDWASRPSWGDQMPGIPQLVAATPDNVVSLPGSSTKIFYKGSDLTYDGISGSQALYTVDGDKVIIVVDGNLNLRNFNTTTSHALEVINNGFIGFIVSGNITIEDTVGNSSGNYGTPNLQGVFITSQDIVVPTSSLQLAARGTYVGWGDIDFNRSLLDTDNNTTPAEVFTYDPELIMNAPRELRRARLIWSEIAPQTF